MAFIWDLFFNITPIFEAFKKKGMKYILSTMSILMVAILVWSCASKEQYPITVYGSSQCPHCVDFLGQLDSANMQYDFRDFMLAEKKYDEEMLHKLDSINFRGYIKLPVVMVGEHIFNDAKFNDVKDVAFD